MTISICRQSKDVRVVSRLLLLSAVMGITYLANLAETRAVPVQGQYQDNPSLCDIHPTQNFGHELGDITVGFPFDEAFQVSSSLTTQLACVGDDGITNDYLVSILNISPYPYRDLFFVVDDGIFVGNADGAITDLTAPGFTDAFKIDNLGVNNNLLSGDLNNNLIFDPGETWQFLVTNFLAPGNAPPLFGSVGQFAASSSADTISNASILANRIPEPCSATLLASLAACAFCKRIGRRWPGRRQ